MNIQKVEVPLEVRQYGPKGRGVCVLQDISPGTVLEKLPVLIIDKMTYAITKMLPIVRHTFVWSDNKSTGAIGFGFASLCNHSEQPNAIIRKNKDEESIELIADTFIPAESEVTIRYRRTLFKVFD